MPTKNKYKIPEDVKRTVISLVKGQERRKKEYKESKEQIINGSSAPFSEYIATKPNGEKEIRRAYMPRGNAKNSIIEDKALALKALDEQYSTVIMNVIDEELHKIGNDILSLKLRQELIGAVYKNCLSRDYPYEYFYLPGISRNMFFCYRNAFLYSVAKRLNLF